MPDERACLPILLAMVVSALLGGGCTTGFELRARADGGAGDAGRDGSAADGETDAGLCREAGDRCCAEAARGAFCVGGLVCSEGFCAPCPGGLFACGNACVDLQTNGRHCGVCGTVCTEGQRCASGSCTLDCSAPDALCGGRCVHLQSDDAHCGACGRACAGAAGSNTVGRCLGGACQRACEPGFGDCDGEVGNGCEVDTRASAEHCGGCGRACAPLRATGACVAGACTVARCGAGFGDCDGAFGNGCEVDLRRDTAHCGGCGLACAAGQICRDALCLAAATACSPGTADCRADAPGCETPIGGDVMNCGACGRACSFPGAAAGCAGGVCALGACAAGSADCDRAASNGCEVRTATDPDHCGACGRACAAANGVAVCTGGACALATCNAGFGDCDRAAANGCEVDLGASAAHCGRCAAACPSGRICSGGVCGRSCAPGETECDGACVDLASSDSHCGACGAACAAGANQQAACVAGVCRRSCVASFGDCDGSGANGCESNLAVSRAHCGACGVACASPPNAEGLCESGRCLLACAIGFRDCDGSAADGCEVAINGDAANCGRCGYACPAAGSATLHTTTSVCAAGACSFQCAAGWADCNHLEADGCEASLSEVAHCGNCTTQCPEERLTTPVCCSSATTSPVCCRRTQLAVICLNGSGMLFCR